MAALGDDNYSESSTVVRILWSGQRVFDRYTLRRELGRGGMGVVWLARDETLGREVALKFLPEVVGSDERAVEDLKHETRRALELTHPNIVRIHDFLEDRRMAAVSMEFVDGPSLARLALKKPGRSFEVDEVAAWVPQLCAALDYAHVQARIVHRDLKPANLMISSRGMPKVADFGISASVSETVTRANRTAVGGGTPVYMSPQQMQGALPTPADDIYSLGATLYEMLTGRPPFFRGDISHQVLCEVPPTLAQRRSELGAPPSAEPIPSAWEAIVAACLQKDPMLRPATAGAVAEAMQLGRDRSAITFLPSASDESELEMRRAAPAGYDASEATTVVSSPDLNKRDSGPQGWVPSFDNPRCGEPEASGRRSGSPDREQTSQPPGGGAGVQSRTFTRPWMGLSLVVVLLVLGGAAWYAGTRDRPKGLYPQPGDPPPVESPREIGAISTDDPEAIASAPPRESGSADVLGNVPSTADGTLAMETPASAEPRGPDLGSPWTVPTIQLEMIWNAAGTFTMGSPRAESGRMASEGPQTRVTLSQGFWLGKYEVTQGQWDALMAGNPSEFENAGANAPVENLSWNEAMAFCRKLTAIERDAGRIPEGYAYSLPTEAQWEFACRAGTSEPLSSGPLTFRGGNDAPELDAVAWYGGNSGVAYEGGRDSSGWKNKQYPHTKAGTHPVGQKQANPWGFHDMHGNVWEWCADRLSNTLPGGDVIDPAGSPSSSVRVIRGGGWDSIVWSCRSASRRGIKPDNRAPNVGFRLALTPAHEANPTRSAQGYD